MDPLTPDERAALDFLRWIYGALDFGPAHEDVMECYLEEYTRRTGKAVPTGYVPGEQ